MDVARPSSSSSVRVPETGTLVGGRYRIGRTLGEGGMGVVLAARDEQRENVEVALKLLQAVGEANAERFLREARLAAKIESEHVVRVLDSGSLDGHPFLVMERLDGEDFGAKVRGVEEEGGGAGAGPRANGKSALPLVEVADCLIQTCEALAHAHGAGIVHRDIKASNLFEHIRSDSSTGTGAKIGTKIVKVLDFGISKIFAGGGPEPERTLTRTRDGGFLGSPPYMSPEHVRDPRNVDGRADLWSCGVVAYRLLSARFPFVGESTGEVLAAILERRPARLRDLGIDVPIEIDAIIARCLSRAREDRYADAGALAAALAPFASPQWRSYGVSVGAIVKRAPVRSPAVVTPFVEEPSTRTVPPPTASSSSSSSSDVMDASATAPILPRVVPLPPKSRSSNERTSVTQLMASAPVRSVPPTAAPPIVQPASPAPPRSSPTPMIAIVIGGLVAIAIVVAIVTTMRHRDGDGAQSPATTVPDPPTASTPPVTAASAPPVLDPPTSSLPASTPQAKGARPGRHHAAPPPPPPPPPTTAQPSATTSQKKPELQPNPYNL